MTSLDIDHAAAGQVQSSPPSDPSPDRTGLRKLIWKLALPVPCLLLLSVVGIWIALPPMFAENAYNDVVRAATGTVAQFKILRGYYTENVIKKVVASGALKPSYDHKTEPGSVPLPATMIHDLSELLGEAGTSLNLYSGHPFPNRSSRQLDAFQQEAWDYLTRNPDSTFVRQESRNGSEVVRVAVADRMTVAACVNCHNKHPASPKTDWKLGDVRGVLEVGTVIDAQLADGARLAGRLTIGVLVIGTILAAVCVMIARQITGPLGRMTAVMRRLAGGEHEVEIPGMERRDEIGAMARAVRVFKDTMIETERLRSEQEAAKARADEEKQSALSRLANAFEASVKGIVDGVSTSATGMQGSAQELSSAAGQTTHESTAASTGAERTSQNVQSVSAAAEELAASITEISRQVANSTRITSRAVDEAARTDETVRGLATAAQKIGEVVKLITDIAEQTNLLALNATIEAARAGEAGKGFAVVAGEVKSLAGQTAKATDEISGQVAAIQAATEQAVGAIRVIGQTVGEVSEITTSLASAIEEQGAATQEITRNAQEAASGTADVSASIAGVAQAAGQTGTAASEVLDASVDLSQQATNLRSEVDRFLATIRTV